MSGMSRSVGSVEITKSPRRLISCGSAISDIVSFLRFVPNATPGRHPNHDDTCESEKVLRYGRDPTTMRRGAVKCPVLTRKGWLQRPAGDPRSSGRQLAGCSRSD